mmetsp:Transcript_21566/g.73952  ORF Transcript_21566/g.73952 Transcript_21566/m.73952 type:complete len:589 (+) Transcript_21566:1601-3367(+)
MFFQSFHPQSPSIFPDHAGLWVQHVGHTAADGKVDALLLLETVHIGLLGFLLNPQRTFALGSEVVPISLDLALQLQLPEPLTHPLAELPVLEGFGRDRAFVEDQAINLINDENGLLQPFFVLLDVPLNQHIQASLFDVIPRAIDNLAVLVLEVTPITAGMEPQGRKKALAGIEVSMGQNSVVVDHMCPKAALRDKSSNHCNDKRLPLACADTSKHRLRQPVSPCAHGPCTTGSDRKHQQRDHLCVMGQHQHTEALPHALSCSTCDLQDPLPIRRLEPDTTPSDTAWQGRRATPDDLGDVHVRRHIFGAVTCEGSSVDFPYTLDQFNQQLILGTPALSFKLIEGHLQVLFAHVLQGKNHSVQSSERSGPTTGGSLPQEGLHSLLGPLKERNRSAPALELVGQENTSFSKFSCALQKLYKAEVCILLELGRAHNLNDMSEQALRNEVVIATLGNVQEDPLCGDIGWRTQGPEQLRYSLEQASEHALCRGHADGRCGLGIAQMLLHLRENRLVQKELLERRVEKPEISQQSVEVAYLQQVATVSLLDVLRHCEAERAAHGGQPVQAKRQATGPLLEGLHEAPNAACSEGEV